MEGTNRTIDPTPASSAHGPPATRVLAVEEFFAPELSYTLALNWGLFACNALSLFLILHLPSLLFPLFRFPG
jgi:hypothetical protein